MQACDLEVSHVTLYARVHFCPSRVCQEQCSRVLNSINPPVGKVGGEDDLGENKEWWWVRRLREAKALERAENAAALTLQRSTRIMLERRRRAAEVVRADKTRVAAMMIQRRVRGRQARHFVETLQQLHAEQAAVLTLQCSFRMLLACRRAAERKVVVRREADKKRAAAVMIQKYARGKQARQRVAALASKPKTTRRPLGCWGPPRKQEAPRAAGERPFSSGPPPSSTARPGRLPRPMKRVGTALARVGRKILSPVVRVGRFVRGRDC